MSSLFNLLNRMLPFWPVRNKKAKKEGKKPEGDSRNLRGDFRDLGRREADLKGIFLDSNLEENLRLIKEFAGNSYDLNIMRHLAGPEKVKYAVIFIDGLTEKETVNDLMRIIQMETFKTGIGGLDKKDIYETVKNRLLTGELRETESLKHLFESIFLGYTALLFDGTAKAILNETRGWPIRPPAEPEAETTIRAPREGFVENIRVNTSLIRRRIRTPNLWIESSLVGSLTRTEVAFAYIKGLVGEEVLGELRSRLQRIDIDGILESGAIEEYIRDAPYSPFPTIFRTERPDRVAAAILEGRVALFTNGTPFVLILPADFPMFLQAPDDYNELWPIGTFLRLLRMLSYLISIFLPGLYVAVLNFHPELLPTSLLLTIQQTREGVPFPVVAEIIIMEAAFEILREAGLRLPRAIGPAISIVGALILGEAAIRAGIVSPGVVIIVAFTAIASFSSPTFSFAITARLLRFGVIITGAALGLLGIQGSFLILVIHLVSLRSFGYPYMAPYGPLIWADMKDIVYRDFWWRQIHRPRLLGFREPQRQTSGQGPRIPGDNKNSRQRNRKGR